MDGLPCALDRYHATRSRRPPGWSATPPPGCGLLAAAAELAGEHVARIQHAFGAASRVQAVLRAVRQGRYIPPALRADRPAGS